jgi:hydrogenase maturation factor
MGSGLIGSEPFCSGKGLPCMCIPLVARVCAIDAGRSETGLIEVELLSGGSRVEVSPALFPEVDIGQHVLVDRGLIIELIDAEQAESLLAFYAELEQAWDELEAASG